ncbi:hypothetical protein B0O80DRAFT_301811 [Mortierella sp. GBAus27b]|nr:hypothetical protein BGX31_005924 [Mortierella sp. GBA43]KAI8356905.1 hypothetical protein B0O80DRAFT_301811 [Mortierella sp. GBAus27b]
MNGTAAGPLELVRATEPDVIRQVWLNSKGHFAPDMPDELWLEKAMIRGSLDHGLGVGHKIWILVPEGKRNDPSAILCSLHTYDRPGIMARHSGDSQTSQPGVELKNVAVAYVLLVFTPEVHRRKGYARTTLRILRECLATETHPVIDLSFLYSKVGRDFYASLGWLPVQSRELVMEVPSYVFPDLPANQMNTPSYALQDITESNLQVTMDRDIELLRSELLERALSAPQGSLVMAITPEARIFRGQLTIARFTNSKVVKIDKPITRIGVRLVDCANPGGEDVFIIWTYHLQSKLLLVLRIRYGTIYQLQCLLKEAMKEAKEWGVDKVSLWGLNDADAIQATGISNRDRTTAWSCINQIRQPKAHEGLISQDTVVMVNDEAYVWGL